MSEENQEAMVPSARLREESAAKRAALQRASELEAQVAELSRKAATVDTLAAQVAELQAQHTGAVSAWESERAVYRVGITDPEAVEIAKMLHGKLPEENRPPLADWLSAAKSDPSKAPKALQPYLAAQPAASSSPPSPPAASAPPGRQAATPPASGGTQMSADQVRALREQCQRTGDWKPWREAQAAMR